eukprot:gene5046-8642_t
MNESIVKVFKQRIPNLLKIWETSPAWKNIDCFEVSVGTVEDTISNSSIFQIWSTGYEFSHTIFFFTKKKLFILTGKKKAKVLSELKCENYEIEVFEKTENNDKTFEKMIEEIKNKKIGMLTQEKKEEKEGSIISEWYKKLDGIEKIPLQKSLEDLYSVKQNDEIDFIKKSSNFVAKTIKNFVQPELESLIVNDKSITHKKLSDLIEEKVIQNENFDVCFPPLIQSGSKYSSEIPSEESLKFDTIICKLGTKYQGYCSIIERTFMIDASKDQEDDYHLLEKIYKFIFSTIKINMKLNEIYEKTIDFIKKENEDMLKFFSKSIGFGIGLEKKEKNLEINETNEYQIQKGNVFVISISIEKPGKYKISLSDTILMNQEEKIELLTKGVEYAYAEVSYSIDDEEEQLNEEVTQLDKHDILAEGSKRKKETDLAENRRKKQQEELLKKKREESKNSKVVKAKKGDKYSLDESLGKNEIFSYDSISEMPQKKNNRIEIDDKNETILLPINGNHVPFHIASIKNVSKSEEGEYIYFRINFKNFGNIGQVYAPTKIFPDSIFLKEISIRSKDPKNIILMNKLITALKKKVTQKEKDIIEQQGIIQQEKLELLKVNVQRLRDVVVRPNLKGKKTIGKLEAHKNGLRFISNRNEVIDITYKNVQHSFYQPATQTDPFVLIHFHLYHPIMIGKKKTFDVQFYSEVMDEIDQLVGRGRKNMSDRESMDEEKRQNAYKQKLNKEFHTFSKKIEEISDLEFDMPYRDLEFTGTPFRSAIKLVPTVNCLVSLNELPFFVVPLDQIELVYLERVSFGLKNFDMVLVFKDYSKPVVNISAIPVFQLDLIKDWLTETELKYFEGITNLVWNNIMKTIKEDTEWEPWGTDGWNSILNPEIEEGVDDIEDEDDEEFNISDDEEIDDESEDDHKIDSEDDFESDEEDEDDDEFAGERELSDDELGEDWDELEEDAIKHDSRKELSDEEDERPKKKRRK